MVFDGLPHLLDAQEPVLGEGTPQLFLESEVLQATAGKLAVAGAV